MTDRNPMMQGLQNPIAGVGIIPTKGFLDFDLIHQCQSNAEDPRIAMGCYPGGGADENHDAMPGDTSYGQKDVRNTFVEQGEPNELGIVSVAGLNWSRYCSQREMEDKFYWQGVVTTESRLTNPLDGTTSDPDHGYGMTKAGTVSVINNGRKTIYAGNPIAWQFPPAPFHPHSKGKAFNDGSDINALARQGVPSGQFRPEYVPFDPNDFSVQLAAAFAAICEPKDNGGVSDMSLVAAFPSINGYADDKPWTGIQDEGNAYKYSIAGKALTFVETLIRYGFLQAGPELQNQNAALNPLAESAEEAHRTASACATAIGLWSFDIEEQTPLIEALADVFMENIAPIDPRRTAAVDRFQRVIQANGVDADTLATTDPLTDQARYARLRYHVMEIATQGVTSSWYSKTSKIVGRALNTAAPADTMHVLWGHIAM